MPAVHAEGEPMAAPLLPSSSMIMASCVALLALRTCWGASRLASERTSARFAKPSFGLVATLQICSLNLFAQGTNLTIFRGDLNCDTVQRRGSKPNISSCSWRAALPRKLLQNIAAAFGVSISLVMRCGVDGCWRTTRTDCYPSEWEWTEMSSWE